MSDRSLGRYEASVASLRPIRSLVSDAVSGWRCAPLLDDAVLCASELASNAILHTRRPFSVEVRKVEGGVRVEVSDQRPRELPALVPFTGIATDITSQGTTGRGLQIVAALADRWGVTRDADTKSVWVELRPGSRAERTPPVVVLGEPDRAAADDDAVTLRFLSLPVRAAVASGMHLDGLVRELQLSLGEPTDEALDRLYSLLDESAPLRLEGRRRALEAASLDQPRYDLTIHTSTGSLTSVARLNELMAQLARDRRAAEVPAEVAAFRTWLAAETERQMRGAEPTPCPLD